MRDVVRRLWLAVLGICFFGMGTGHATEWCGENGVVRFSFTAGDSLVEIWDSGEPVNGVTTIDVVAWLTDIQAVERDMEQFLNIGGFEMELTIEGAEGFILQQELAAEGINVGRSNGSLAVGLTRGLRLRNGRARLVSWRVMFQGQPENVRFGLKANGSVSCKSVTGCPQAQPPAVYIGGRSSGQAGDLFGAGYVPAWLNPVGVPDRTAVHATESFADVGLFELSRP